MMADLVHKDRWDRVILWAVPLLNFLQGDEGEELHPADVHPYRDHADYEPGEYVEPTREEFVIKHFNKLKLLPPDQQRKIEEHYQKHGIRTIH